MRKTTRIDVDQYESIAEQASAFSLKAFSLFKGYEILCEDCPEYSKDVLADKTFTGDVDVLVYTAIHVANKLGIPMKDMGVLLCITHTGEKHVVAYYRCPLLGLFIFGDYHQPGIYSYSDLEYRIEYFVNIETGYMKTMVDLKKL